MPARRWPAGWPNRRRRRRSSDGWPSCSISTTRPERIEVYDNSHISGTNPVGAMIVAGPEGFIKGQYRKFNMKSEDLAPGDDYAMMREMLTRRFSKLAKAKGDVNGWAAPDLVLIDGGPGQLAAAYAVLDELGLSEIKVAAVAKGPDRNAGRERIHLRGKDPLLLEPRDPVLYCIQTLRDEAHRFAIGAHRAQRKKAITASPLDEVPGIGPSPQAGPAPAFRLGQGGQPRRHRRSRKRRRHQRANGQDHL